MAGSLWFVRSSPQAEQAPAPVRRLSLLVKFGVNDAQPTSWDGTVEALAGTVRALHNYRPKSKQRVEGNRSWSLSSDWSPRFQYRSWEQELMQQSPREMQYPALVVEVSGHEAALRFQTRQGEFRVNAADLAAGRTKSYLNSRVTAELIPSAAKLSDDSRENDFPSIARGANGETWTAWVAYQKGASEVLARRFDGNAWQAAQPITTQPGDVYRVQIAQAGKRLWVVWSEQRNGNFDLYGRSFDGKAWGSVERITDAAGSDVHHRLTADASGNLWIAWQAFRDGVSRVFVRRHDGASWIEPTQLSNNKGDAWYPAIAADGKGRVYAAWDTYEDGNYDIVYRSYEGGQWKATAPIANTLRYEANVSLTCDGEGRLWAAWNESGLRWGKDTGLLVRRPATAIYDGRYVAVAALEGGTWKEPAKEFEASLPLKMRDHNDLPVLQTDGAGRVWVLFRHRFDAIPAVPSTAALHGAAWESFAVTYAGDRWSSPIALASSQGRSDQAPAAISDGRTGLHLAWASDNRDFTDTWHKHGDVYSGSLAASGTAIKPVLRERVPIELRQFEANANEVEDLKRIRSYRIQSGDANYRIVRGDLHRHTEISRDGKNDGAIVDTYRYAVNAASLDFLGISDHNTQGGPDVEYINWMNQQIADVFLMKGRFTPLYGYERSLNYPNGHRNVMFAVRGNPTLPIPAEETSGKVGAAALYDYLKKRRGIAISHTSATNMGTDWRDNDQAVEPLVEIYQGDRVSAEHEGAPKAASADDVTSHAGGYRPAGYVWNAWAKGYKLGVQASSDHLSTHISYACTLVTDFTQEGLLDGMRKRHSYAATDNIILDYRMETAAGELIQGDIGQVQGPYRLRVRVIGTAPIRQIDIIRKNEYLHTRQALGKEVDFTFVDNQPLPGESYYYVRVQQVDEQMAWSSPIWIQR